MTIVILANNPIFIEKHENLIKNYACHSDIFVSIKFKYVNLVLDQQLKQHDIYFRLNNQNFIFGFNDYHHAFLGKLKPNTSLFLISNITNGVFEKFDDTSYKTFDFTLFDYDPFISYLKSFEKTSIFKKIDNLIFINNLLDTNKLSTGFWVALKYYLLFPNAKIQLLGFYELGNQTVLKEGKRISVSSHQFQVEKEILIYLAPNLIFIN
jgi:hypothetical protein